MTNGVAYFVEALVTTNSFIKFAKYDGWKKGKKVLTKTSIFKQQNFQSNIFSVKIIKIMH